MRRFTIILVLVLAVADAAVAGDYRGLLAVEPFLEYGRSGDITATTSLNGEVQQAAKIDFGGYNVETGVRFIVPATERLELRGLFAYKYARVEVREGFEPAGKTDGRELIAAQAIEEIATQPAWTAGVSLRYWFGRQ